MKQVEVERRRERGGGKPEKIDASLDVIDRRTFGELHEEFVAARSQRWADGGVRLGD